MFVEREKLIITIQKQLRMMSLIKKTFLYVLAVYLYKYLVVLDAQDIYPESVGCIYDLTWPYILMEEKSYGWEGSVT